MDFFNYFHSEISKIVELVAKDLAVEFDSSFLRFAVEVPKNEHHGDVATNVAMLLAKKFNKNPMQLAEIIVTHLEKLDSVQSVNVAKPGFINIIPKHSFWQKQLFNILNLAENYGRVITSNNKKVNIEYVSANPTGPMHIGHGRGAVVGDILAKLYMFLGYDVTKEYYVNDSGGQINVLGKSLYFRYLELLNKTDSFVREENFYPGDYLIAVAEKLLQQDKEKWVGLEESLWLPYFKTFALQEMLTLIKNDLKLIDVNHDVFTSEKEVATDVNYLEVLEKLTSKDLIYIGTLNIPKGKMAEDFEIREQKLFKSTNYGDDSDRALEKSSGERTYFANDVVYHYNKIKRGFDKLINIWGADHIGYIKRVVSSVDALSDGKVSLDVAGCQLINLMDNGVPVKMSKRAGNFVTLQDLITEVGKDVFRVMMISRKNEMSIDFDLAEIKGQTSENPVFYIQYAYARVNSVLRNYAVELNKEITMEELKTADFSLLGHENELKLLKSLLKLPKTLDLAIVGSDPHRLYLYLIEIATNFHSLWNKGKENNDLRFIIKNNQQLTIARLALLKATSISLANVLNIIGVHIREKM
jgi:arginyl-tRNA synthetase